MNKKISKNIIPRKERKLQSFRIGEIFSLHTVLEKITSEKGKYNKSLTRI